jgi:hypothetical protein
VGVATSSRQFFMQIGQVMGVAIFGLVFTTTYQSSFTSDISPDTRAVLAQAGATGSFNDATLALDKRTSDKVNAEVLAQPGGAAALAQASQAQRHATATATERLFVGSTIAGLIVVLIAVTLKEIPLRRTFAEEAETEGGRRKIEPELVFVE